jgi:glycosyltransferase involved in cell wall biosynthesis
MDVTVIAGQPNDNPDGVQFRRRGIEIRRGVTLRRVGHTRFSKRSLAGRIVNYLTFLFCAFWASLLGKRPDVAVVQTDPPLLCLIGWYLQRVRGAKLVVCLQDVHPDIAIAIGKLRGGRLLRALRRLMFHVYRGADRIVVPSRDMRRSVIASGVDPRRVQCLPNWIDTALVRPIKCNNAFRRQQDLAGRFVVMYSGNLGLCQCLEDVIAAAACLRDRKDILFLLVGGGALKTRLQRQAADLQLSNVRFLPYQPKLALAESLSAADVHLVPLDPRVASLLMPSKFYGVLASGTPLVAIAPDGCELAELTRKQGVGVVARPGEPQALAEILRELAGNARELSAKGRLARRLAVARYDRKRITSRFARMLSEVIANGPAAPPGS